MAPDHPSLKQKRITEKISGLHTDGQGTIWLQIRDAFTWVVLLIRAWFLKNVLKSAKLTLFFLMHNSIWFVFSVFETDSLAEAGIELSTTLNFQFSCRHLLNTGIIGVCHQAYGDHTQGFKHAWQIPYQLSDILSLLTMSLSILVDSLKGVICSNRTTLLVPAFWG